MHLKVIYATPDKDVAKTLNEELNNNINPNLVIADQLDISDESLQDLIPSADYVVNILAIGTLTSHTLKIRTI